MASEPTPCIFVFPLGGWRFKKIIGERSEPPSDKLGGEICIATRALVFIYIYIYMRTA